jgi:hypothetical protein
MAFNSMAICQIWQCLVTPISVTYHWTTAPSNKAMITQPHYMSVNNATTPSEQLCYNYCYHHQPSHLPQVHS